jgi:septal ring factor EnvC (AmiA/AmiB activator)
MSGATDNRTLEEIQAFAERLKKLGEISAEHSAASDAEHAAMKRRNAARQAYVQYYAETERMFPGNRMPFYAESIFGPKQS